jgi:hypothetical protein
MNSMGTSRKRHNGFSTMPSRAVRSSHLGFDCYMQGSSGTGIGRIRILKRDTRLPPHLDQELRFRLPVEMVWPEPNATMAHHCIDAVLTLNVNQLAEWKSQWGDHRFGFEDFLSWAQERVEEKRASGKHNSLPQEQAIPLRRFANPVQEVIPLGEQDMGDHIVSLAYVKFEGADEGLRVTVRGRIGDDRIRLSRAFVDLLTNEYDIAEHYPGRYKALGLPQSLITDALGVRRLRIRRRVSKYAKANVTVEPVPDAGADWRERRPHSKRVAAQATVAQEAILAEPARFPTFSEVKRRKA